MSADLDFALQLARVADDITMSHYRALDLKIDTKPDRTPVTEADTATETALREVIKQALPEDGILGEEFDDVNPQAARKWVIDPIDGTRNYLRGVPVWATLIALLVDGVPTVGVVSAPALGRTWWAEVGHGAHTRDINGTSRQISVSGISQVGDASFSYSDHIGWERFGANVLPALQNSAERVRAYGDFWSHMMVAEGIIEFAAEPELSPWDQAALIPVVREAGGTMTGIEGDDVFASKSSLTSNTHLHDALLELVRQARY